MFWRGQQRVGCDLLSLVCVAWCKSPPLHVFWKHCYQYLGFKINKYIIYSIVCFTTVPLSLAWQWASCQLVICLPVRNLFPNHFFFLRPESVSLHNLYIWHLFFSSSFFRPESLFLYITHPTPFYVSCFSFFFFFSFLFIPSLSLCTQHVSSAMVLQQGKDPTSLLCKKRAHVAPQGPTPIFDRWTHAYTLLPPHPWRQ